MALRVHPGRGMRMPRLLSLGLLASVTLTGCAGDEGVEDPADDVFLTEGAKADAFGVEDWSPDGRAVLTFVTSASAATLEDDVGLSARVAAAIVAHRATLTGGEYHDLAELDAARYVGVTVFKKLLRHAADNHLFKTSIRIPLVVDGDSRVSITTFNDEARTAGVTGFAAYTFVDANTDYTKKANSYNTRLAELATRAGIEIGEISIYKRSLPDYPVGSPEPWFNGAPLEVSDVTSSQADGLMSDMYSLWGWRYQSKTWIYDDQTEEDMAFGEEWTAWSKTSKAVLLMSTATDGGEEPEADVIAPCR